MLEKSDDSLIYLSAGMIAAIVLGMALIPLRDVNTASNFTFPFLALTILVAELGGRRAAVATALTSVLSLDFFLTKPYLRLAIDEKHDIIAFFGLTACGLIAAVFGSQRGTGLRALTVARLRLQLLHDGLREIDQAGSVEPALERTLHAMRSAFPLAAAVIRDERGEVVVASDRSEARAVPAQLLEPETLLPAGASDRIVARDLPLPADGGRIPLRAGRGQVGWLDVWGNGDPASAETRRALIDVGRLLGHLLARAAPFSSSRD